MNTPTAEALLPEVKAYLAAIAQAHGEQSPQFDDAKMSEILNGLLESEQPQQKEQFSRKGLLLLYAAHHAPKGEGIEINGKKYKPGEFIPGDAAESAPAEIKSKLEKLNAPFHGERNAEHQAKHHEKVIRNFHAGRVGKAKAEKHIRGHAKEARAKTYAAFKEWYEEAKQKYSGQYGEDAMSSEEWRWVRMAFEAVAHRMAEKHSAMADDAMNAIHNATEGRVSRADADIVHEHASQYLETFNAAFDDHIKPRMEQFKAAHKPISEPQRNSRHGKPRRYTLDATGHEHKGPGAGGGQFTSGGNGVGGQPAQPQQPAASQQPQPAAQPKPKSQARQEWEQRKAANDAAHQQALAAHAAAVQKQADDYDAAVNAWNARDDARKERDDAAYTAGDDIVSTDKPEPGDEPNVAYGEEVLRTWRAAFGDGENGGFLGKEMAEAGANERELKKLTILGGRAEAALLSGHTKASKEQAKADKARDALAAHEASPQPIEPDIEEPVEPETPSNFPEPDEPEVEKEWDAYNDAQEAYEKAHEDYNNAVAEWEETGDDLRNKSEEADEKAAEAWDKLDDAWDAWRDKIGDEVSNIQAAIRERIEKESDADPEPDEPKELEPPEEPDEEDEPEDDDEDEDDEDTDDDEDAEPVQRELFSRAEKRWKKRRYDKPQPVQTPAPVTLDERLRQDLAVLAAQQAEALRRADEAKHHAEAQRERERKLLLEAVRKDDAEQYAAKQQLSDRQTLIDAIRSGLKTDIAEAVKDAMPSPIISSRPERGKDGRYTRIVCTHEDGTESVRRIERDADGNAADVVAEE